MAATRQLNPDLQNLKDYVTADTGAQRQGDSTVRIMVTHSNLAAKFLEIRLDKHVRLLGPQPGVPRLPHSTAWLPRHAWWAACGGRPPAPASRRPARPARSRAARAASRPSRGRKNTMI